MEGWVDLGGWLHPEMVYLPQAVTHRSINRARRTVTSLIGSDAFTTPRLPPTQSHMLARCGRYQSSRLCQNWLARWPACYWHWWRAWVKHSVRQTLRSQWHLRSLLTLASVCHNSLLYLMRQQQQPQRQQWCLHHSSPLAVTLCVEDLGRPMLHRSKSFCVESYSTWSAPVSTAVSLSCTTLFTIMSCI